MNSQPIEHEFYVLTLDEQNSNYRIYSEKLVKEWILDLDNIENKGFKVEFAVDMDESNLKTEYIKDILYCGLVTEVTIKEIEGKKQLFAKAKFKIKGAFAENFRIPGYFDNLTLVPKGKGQVTENKIYNYTLYGFNLISKQVSPFILLQK